MVYAYPAGASTHVQSFGQGSLIIDFSRNQRDFKVNKYMQIVPVKKTTDLYLKMGIDECARIINGDLAEFSWPDGSDRPGGNDGNEQFTFLPYMTQRKLYSARIGKLASANADWDIIQHHSRIKAAQAMTARTVKSLSVMTDTANYEASHTIDVTTISDESGANSGDWGAATVANGNIQRSLGYAANKIMMDSNSVVKPEDLVVVMSPTCARSIALTQEIKDYMKGSYEAGKVVRGEESWSNKTWNLPPELFGYSTIVEDTVKVTTRKGGTQTRSYAMPDDKPFMCARVGGLEGVAEAPNFSTGVIFVYSDDDMSLEVYEDIRNRRTDIGVVDNFDVRLVASVSGFLFQNVL